jgi:poly(hydroxyalkanoate) depolymerase family esterase
MNMDFAAAMRAATRLTRAQKLMDATRVIRSALSDRAPVAKPTRAQAIDGRAIDQTVIDLAPDTTGAEITAPPRVEADRRGPESASEGSRSESTRRDHRTAAPASWSVGDLATLRPAGLPSFGADPLAGARPHRALTIPDGAQFLSRSFVCTAGQRSYKLYVPHRHHSRRRALLIMLHGGTQDADDFAAGTRMHVLAEEHGFVVAFPSQCRSANQSLCWNWFHPEHQMRGAGEPSIIAGITREIASEYDIDPQRVFVAGLSAGGAMATVMGETYPEIYAAIGVHSGLPYKSATDLASAFVAMRGDLGLHCRSGQRKPRRVAANGPRMRTIVFHGDADKIVHPSNASRIIEAQGKLGDRVERTTPRSPASRTYTRAVTRDKTGSVVVEQWLIHGSGHAWSGGSPDGTYTDPQGPDASREMLRFFLEALPR